MYRSPNIVGVIKSRGLRWAGHVARMVGWEGRNVFKILIGILTLGRYTLGRHRDRWDHNVRIDLKKISIKVRNWNGSAQHRD